MEIRGKWGCEVLNRGLCATAMYYRKLPYVWDKAVNQLKISMKKATF